MEQLLHSEFELETYLAFKVQSLKDIMEITRQLSASDYYLFIDFLRKPNINFISRLCKERPLDAPYSLFTHQELALAHHLDFDVIALQQEGCPQEGFLKYVLSNPEKFEDTADLLDKVRRLVSDKKWSKDYSRSLVARRIYGDRIVHYRDHSGEFDIRPWQAEIEARRPDRAAFNAICILDAIKSSSGVVSSPDRSHLKWTGQHQSYQRLIFPRSFETVTIFYTRRDTRGAFLASALDLYPRTAIIPDGQYEFRYKVYAIEFPILEFSVDVTIDTDPTRGWPDNSTAKLLV